MTSYFRLGGAIVLREFDNNRDQGPFDASFQDFRLNGQVFTLAQDRDVCGIPSAEYCDRQNPNNPAYFGDVSAAGETRVQDLSVEVGRGFFENRVNVKGGAFFRRINFQDTYYVINNAQDKGWLANASLRVDSRTRLFFDYSLDTDFFVWRPSIKNGQIFRVGLDWKY